MDKNTKIGLAIAVIIVVAVVAYYFYAKDDTAKVDAVAEKLKSNPDTYEAIAKQALSRGVTIKQQLKETAKRIANAN